MRIANLDSRLVVLVDTGAVDVERASGGRFAADPQAVFARWDEFRGWGESLLATGPQGESFYESQLGPPVPAPRQVFAIGLNYGAHAREVGLESATDVPSLFTKFPSCIAGPFADVPLPAGRVDWEIELVVVIGKGAYRVAAADAWDHVAGLTVGQDYSERILQMSGAAPQFAFGKSHRNFGPIGPWLVTADQLVDRDNLGLRCEVNGEIMQESRTADMIFPVSETISQVSAVVEMYPGDIIFTGTPPGAGVGRSPRIFLRRGDVVASWIEGIGEIRQQMV